MTYSRFAAMILTSTFVMLVLMYLNTFAEEHVFFSETRVYMAVLMGATMAFVMMAFMFSMYPKRAANYAIFAGSIAVFALSLWLVRSQVTVSGESYMRAMIPHHSIAIMTSKRSGIEDARVRKLADEIIDAQNREISEMRALIEDLDSGDTVQRIYEDPEPEPGSVADALSNTLLAKLDPAPLNPDDISRVLPGGEACTFRRTRSELPILVVAADGNAAAMKLNGVLINLESVGPMEFASDNLRMSVEQVGGWRSDSVLTFSLDPGPTVRYRGFSEC